MRRSTRSSRSVYQDHSYPSHRNSRPYHSSTWTPDLAWGEQTRHTAQHPELYDERYDQQFSAEPFDDFGWDHYQTVPRALSFADRVFGQDSTVSRIISRVGSMFSTILVVPQTAYDLASSALSTIKWGVAYLTGRTFTSVPSEEWASKLCPDDDLWMLPADRMMGSQIYAEYITDASTDYQARVRDEWYRQNPDYLYDPPSSMKPEWWQRRGKVPEKSVRFLGSG